MSAVSARPGDTIIFTVPDFLSDDDYQTLLGRWKVLTELGVKIAIAEGVSSVVVVKPDQKKETDMATPDENPDPWCTSPDPEPAPDIIVVQGSTDDEK